MAYTKSLQTLSAGFSRSELLDFWGELLADIGLMSTATSWYDNFVSTESASLGTEIRVVEEVIDATKAYGKIYHVFGVFPEGTTDGGTPNALWYQTTSGWDAANHEATGTREVDYGGSYTDMTRNSFSVWPYFFAAIFNSSNASDLRAHVFTETNEPSYILIESSEDYLIGYHQATISDFREPDLLDAFIPNGLWGMNVSNFDTLTAGYGTALPRHLSGKLRSSDGDSSYEVPVRREINGWASGSGVDIRILEKDGFSNGLRPFLVSEEGQSDPAMAPYNYQPRYVGIRGIPFDPVVYINKTFGSNVVYLAGYNYDGSAATFQPVTHDSLVVVPGVEEYYVLNSETTNGNDSSSATFFALIIRVV